MVETILKFIIFALKTPYLDLYMLQRQKGETRIVKEKNQKKSKAKKTAKAKAKFPKTKCFR